MRPWNLLPCVALATSACSGQDVDIGHGSIASNPRTSVDAGGTTMPTGTTGNPPAVDHPSAIVLRSIDLPFTGSSSSSSSGAVTAGVSSSATAGTGSSSAGSTIDPDMRYLFIGNGPPTCTDPSAGSPCSFFRVTIRIPSFLFAPGVHSLQDTRIQATYSTRGPDLGGGACSAGGGDFLDGTFELVDIATTVTVRLANTAKPGFDADGSYAAVQCP